MPARPASKLSGPASHRDNTMSSVQITEVKIDLDNCFDPQAMLDYGMGLQGFVRNATWTVRGTTMLFGFDFEAAQAQWAKSQMIKFAAMKGWQVKA